MKANATRQDYKITTRLDIPAKELVIEDMESLGTYRQEFDSIITIYVDLLEQYAVARDRFNSAGQQYSVKGANGQDKKNPILTTMESLRRDILAYSNALELNPKSYLKETAEDTEDKAIPDKPKTMDELFSELAFE